MKIAIGGIAGAGKDYLIKGLSGFYRVAFADELKKECSRIFPWLEKDYGPLEKEQSLKNGMTPRQIWLDVAKTLRKIDENIFITKLEDHLKMVDVPNIIISDIRTKEEFIWCKENGFITIFIEPTNYIYTPNSYDDQLLEFKDEFDHCFVNGFRGSEDQINFNLLLNNLLNT
jgi:hypothetical protein